MFCNECGKHNPEGAKFCAYCGARLLVAAAEPVADVIEPAPDPAPEEAAPAAEPVADVIEPAPEPIADVVEPIAEIVPPAPKPEPFVLEKESEAPARPARPTGHIVRPLADNPAQPARPGDPPKPAPVPVEEPAPVPAEKPAPEEPVAPPFQAEPAREPAQQPFSQRFFTPKMDDDEPDELEDWPEEDETEARKPLFGRAAQDGEKPHRFKLPGLSPEERRKSHLVLTSSGTEEMPARKPPVSSVSREKRDTMVPERVVPEKKAQKLFIQRDEADEDDIFFMKPKKKAPHRSDRAEREAEEEAQDDAYVNSRVRLILAAIAFVVCLSAAFWLFATQSGRVFRAGFGLSDDPAAYRILGDTALANNQVKRAADAYYQALALDPDDYATALLVGQTQQQIGNYDQADRAYQKCIALRPTDPEPYEHIIRLNVVRGDQQRAEYFRQLGLQQTGRSDLG